MKHVLWLMLLIWPRPPSYTSRTTCTDSMLQESTSPAEKQWHSVDICLPFDISTPIPTIYLCQRFFKTRYFKDNRLKCNGTSFAWFQFRTSRQLVTWVCILHTKAGKQLDASDVLMICLLTSQMPLSVTVVPRISVHEDRSQIILEVRLNDSSLPFQALLWEHRWLALCLKPALPSTGISASSWLCTLLHSDDFFQVLPSSLFWLVYDLACLVSLPCLQPPGKEGHSKDPALQG